MRIENKESYREIPISALNLSVRSYNCLMRVGYNTLWLLIKNHDRLPSLRNMGEKSIAEINDLLRTIQETGLPAPKELTADDSAETSEENGSTFLPEELLARPAADLKVPVRVLNYFRREGVNTIGEALSLHDDELLRARNMGALSIQQLREQLALLREIGTAYFDPAIDMQTSTSEQPQHNKRELDIETAKKLREGYGLSSAQLCEWYGVSRQQIHNKLSGKRNRGKWCGKELLPEERASITRMINERAFYYEADGIRYYLLNNKTDDCAFLLISDLEIKCFFLTDLPDALQALARSANLQRLTEEECKNISGMGQRVFILKKPYYMPNKNSVFQKLADVRGMSTQEYAQFLFQLPYCSSKAAITDDRIIAYLKANTVDGITSIPSGPDSQWLISYISRSPFKGKRDEFLAFFGFRTSTSKDHADLASSDDHSEAVERDMQAYGTGSDYLDRIYSDSPLLGSAILSPKNLETMNRNSRNCINRTLNNQRDTLDLKAKMQIALAVINYAKGWDTEDESGFWRYITTQFGYRDENGKLRNLLCQCVKDALTRNRRWFFETSNGNQYKSSIMIHAFSTKRSWMHFCGFLFEFYKTNLDWAYIEDDPMIPRMVQALRNKLSDSGDDSDKDLEISSKYYEFREGIIKLVLHRPQYATQLIASMLRRIHALVNHSAPLARYYEEQLCDEWMEQYLGSLSFVRKRDSSGERRSIAIDYSRIRPVYRLQNESGVGIAFPDVRLAKSDFSSLELTVLHQDQVVEQRALSYYGNELGKTMNGFSLDLTDYLRRSGSATIDPQIMITCDGEKIYDSEELLFRKWLLFSNDNETDFGHCSRGKYSVFVPDDTSAEFSEAEVSVVLENRFLKGYYVSLQKDFAVRMNGELTAFDTTQGSSAIRVLFPESRSVEYTAGGVRFDVISEMDRLQIIVSSHDEAKKYQIAVNKDVRTLGSFPYEETAGAVVFQLELGDFGKEEFSLRLLDLQNNKLMLSKDYKIIPTLSYHFNRPYYFSEEDFRDAQFYLCIGQEAQKEYRFGDRDLRVCIPYQTGELEFPVPMIRIVDNANNLWDGTNRYWIKEIPQERFLQIIAPSGLRTELRLDENRISAESENVFALGNALFGYSGETRHKWLQVYLAVIQDDQNTRKYPIGSIAVGEGQFLGEPEIKLDGTRLWWDMGYGFYGDVNDSFILTIGEGTTQERSFPINLDQETIAEDVTLPVGIYSYSISKRSGNIFLPGMIKLCTGRLLVGNRNELLFEGRIIKIDMITFENDQSNEEAVKIKPCFIDQIRFQGVRYAVTEGRECPVYNGILFFRGKNGQRQEFAYDSTMDERGKLLYPVNPVRIVYINENTLCITHETGDPTDPGAGLYYYHYSNKQTMTNAYQLTDREPERYNRKWYGLADLYSYSIKGEQEHV